MKPLPPDVVDWPEHWAREAGEALRRCWAESGSSEELEHWCLTYILDAQERGPKKYEEALRKELTQVLKDIGWYDRVDFTAEPYAGVAQGLFPGLEDTIKEFLQKE